MVSCQGRFNPKKPTYQIKYGIPVKVEIPKQKCKPIDRTAEKLVEKGVKRVSWGLSLVLGGFCVSIMFSNPITARLSNYAIIGGAFLAGEGFVLVFIAEYLIYFCIIVFLLFGVLLWARKKSIVTLCKGLKKNAPAINDRAADKVSGNGKPSTS